MSRFSLIVATVGRREELLLLLESLSEQSERDFEVIVVDQNPHGFLDDIIERYATSITLIHLHSEQRGASRARNLGIERATGEIVTFPDDDCELPSDLLGRIWTTFQHAPGLAGVTISSIDKHSDGRIARFAGRRGTITKFNILRRCIEAGIFVRRTALNGHRFDESMGVGAASPWWSDEGPDLLLSLMDAGHRFEFHPELVIFHPDPVRLYDDKTILRSFRYGRGRGHYLRKHAYPVWFVVYVWGLYAVGIALGLGTLNLGKANYYYSGLKGRIRGFIDRPERALR